MMLEAFAELPAAAAEIRVTENFTKKFYRFIPAVILLREKKLPRWGKSWEKGKEELKTYSISNLNT